MNKKLLNESEIRKMMKIANLTPLANSFVTTINETYGMEENYLEEAEDELEPTPEDDIGAGMTSGEAPMSVDPALEDPTLDDVGGEPDVTAGDDAAIDADPEMVKGLVMDLIDMVVDAAHEKFGDAAPTADVTEEPPVDEPAADVAPMDDEPVDAAALDEPMGDEGPPPEDDLAAENLYMEDDSLEEDFVNEVTRRVAKRLVRAAKGRRK